METKVWILPDKWEREKGCKFRNSGTDKKTVGRGVEHNEGIDY